ncbi:MAG: preprotein translocase, partial [Betaproteobacteria bacterium]|nr:preprotein translocase [Betaproteobacteria bacterium]
AWFKEVRAIQNPVVSTALQFMLLTGAREGEVLSLRWENVSFQWRKMRIKDKVEESREIPLTNYVAGLLEALPRINEWVFSSERSKSGALSVPSKALQGVCQRANVNHLGVHDLRRSVGAD